MLMQFLKAWLKWAQESENNPVGFIKQSGLCWNLGGIWYDKYAVNEESTRKIELAIDELAYLLKRDFKGDNLNPFNDTISYSTEASKRICHKNKERIEWVTKIIAELEKEQK